MKNSKVLSVTLGAVALLATSPFATAAVIDTFNVSGLQTSGNSASPSAQIQFSLPTSEVVGGSRYLSVSTDDAATFDLGTADINIDNYLSGGSEDELVLNSGPYNAVVAEFTYGFTGDLNTDLTLPGSNSSKASDSIGIQFLEADSPATVTVSVVSNGETAELSLTTMGAGVLYFNFDEFTPTSAGAVDFTDVDQIVLKFVGSLGGDYQVDFIEARFNETQAVPSPAAAGIGLLLVVSGLFKRRRNHREISQ